MILDSSKIKVLLADDHVVIARGLAALLEDEFNLVGVVHDGRALLDAAQTIRPDVVVTDISMPLLNGLDAIFLIREKLPAAKIVVLTMHSETHLAASAFRAGASAYLLKVSPAEELIQAIREVAAGRSYITTLLAKDLITLLMETTPGTTGVAPLTSRQREVLQLIAEGRTMKEVANTLNISSRTAESHKYEIMKILGLSTTVDLVHYAIKNKLVAE